LTNKDPNTKPHTAEEILEIKRKMYLEKEKLKGNYMSILEDYAR